MGLGTVALTFYQVRATVPKNSCASPWYNASSCAAIHTTPMDGSISPER